MIGIRIVTNMELAIHHLLARSDVCTPKFARFWCVNKIFHFIASCLWLTYQDEKPWIERTFLFWMITWIFWYAGLSTTRDRMYLSRISSLQLWEVEWYMRSYSELDTGRSSNSSVSLSKHWHLTVPISSKPSVSPTFCFRLQCLLMAAIKLYIYFPDSGSILFFLRKFIRHCKMVESCFLVTIL